MSGIFDQIINYSPPLIVSGTVNYDGTWDASTNTPTLNNPPAASTKGDYYVVSVAGTQFSLSFAVGDWIISNGTAWEKVDLTDAVSSVFGRTGAVVGVSTDYSAVGLTNTAIGASSPSTGVFTSLSSSSTTTLNGTTVPASKTLVVTTDKLSALAATTSAELAGVISDETGSGALVFASSPSLTTPNLGTPSAVVLTNASGTASININGTVGATTASTGAFTTVSGTTGTFTGNTNVTPITGSRGVFVGADAESASIQTITFGATPFIYGIRVNGTNAAKTATVSGNNLYALSGRGYQTVTPAFSGDAARILFQATENFTDTAHGAQVLIQATANGSSSVGTVATFTSTGLNSTAIGATTASTGAFTTLSATAGLTTGTAAALALGGSGSNLQVGFLSGTVTSTTDAYVSWAGGSSTPLNPSAVNGSLVLAARNTAGAEVVLAAGNTAICRVASAGAAITGTLSCTTGANFATSSGNVGIGTASPSNRLHVENSTNTVAKIKTTGAGSYGALQIFNSNSNGEASIGFRDDSDADAASWVIGKSVNATDAFGWYYGASIMTLTTGGNLLVGTTSATCGGSTMRQHIDASDFCLGLTTAATGTTQALRFAYGSTAVGSITLTSSVTSYNTTSDYRLKNITGPLIDSGTFIDALKPKVGTWKSNGGKFVGFLAHEFAEVSPTSVCGEKDAVDADGKPIHQAMQASSAEVIANLVAELQSVRARLAALESK